MPLPLSKNPPRNDLAAIIDGLTEMPVTLTNTRIGEWELPAEEGKLSVDVAETDKEIMIASTMAGATFDAIDINVHNDILTIRGNRHSPLAHHAADATMVHTECFWGSFSRTIILPAEVKAEQARAEYRNGVLTIIIPKRKVDAKIKVKIVEE